MASVKFLVMVGNDVAQAIYFDDSYPKNMLLKEALLSGVEIIEVAPETDVMTGYTWSNEEFIPPVE